MVKSNNHPDFILLGTLLVLLILGILILASVSASISQEKFGNTYYFLNHQIVFGLLPGIILAFLAYKISLNILKKIAPVLLLINLVLMAMVFLPKIGSALGGATRWLNLGPVSFQPSEILKLTFTLYLAAWLSVRTSHQKKIVGVDFSQTLIAFLFVIGIIGVLFYFQSDVSTLGIISLTAAVMYFLSGTPLWHSILIILIGTGGLALLIKLAPYRLNRLLAFIKPELDPMGITYQIKQALIAIGSGGIFGLGLGMSRQKFGFLPHPMSDSIFAIFAEETGFAGSLILILLFLIFLWRIVKIAKKSSDKFAQLACFGIGFWISLQAFINLGSMMGILPLSGIPLPFISHGGSHLVVEMIGVGIILNTSKHV